MFTKIVTENQADELVEFVTEKFKSLDNLIDWLNPISDELGVVAQTQFTVPCNENDSYQRKQRNFLMLNFGNNKTIIFVINVHKNWRDNHIFGIVDFSEGQKHAKTFVDLQLKNEQYINHLKQTQEMYKEIHKIALFV